MSNLRLLGFPNYGSEGFTTMAARSGVAGLVPSGFEASYLKTEEPSEIARLASLDPRQTLWAAYTAEIAVSLDGLALVNHNLYPGSQVRFLGYYRVDPLTSALADTKVPNSIVASTNITGTAADIDESVNFPDGNAIVPTDTSLPWSVVLGFSSFASGIYPVPSGMAFVLRASRRYSGAGATAPVTAPKLTCDLFENGTLVRTLGFRGVSVDGAAGQLFIFPFSRSELADSSGAGLECRISGGTGNSVSGYQYTALEVLTLYYESAGGDPAYLYDSGWLTIGAGSDGSPSNRNPTQSIHYFPASPWAGVDNVGVLLRSDQCRHDPPEGFPGDVPLGGLNTPADFVQAGGLVFGVASSPQIGIRKGQTPYARPMHEGESGRTLGGQSYGAESFSYRSNDPVSLIVRREEAEFLLRAYWQKGKTRPFYIAMEPHGEPEFQEFTSFYGTFADVSQPVPYGRYSTGGAMKMTMDVQFEEKL